MGVLALLQFDIEILTINNKNEVKKKKNDQNKVFDTGDPGPRASGPAPGPFGNNGAAQVPPHGPPGPGVLGLVVAVPASLPVQPIGADLIKMQDLLLSQKREELFGKKKKNKNKPNKNLVKTTATITS